MVRNVALSLAALVVMGLLDGCASTTPPPAEPAPAVATEPVAPEPAAPAESPAHVDGDTAASDSAAAASSEEPAAQEASEPVADPKPECMSVSDCQAKGKPDKGSKWACDSGVCGQVKTSARKKSK